VESLRRKQLEVRRELENAQAALEACGSDDDAAPVASGQADPLGKAFALSEPRPWCHLSEAQAEISSLRAAGKLVPFGDPNRVPRIYIDGCFDLMHSGHMNAIRQAKLLADEIGGVLVVGVHTDEEIEKNKGPPVMRNMERMALVAAVKWVDELVYDTPYSAKLPFLDSLDIDFCVHGDDMAIAADGTDAYGEVKAAGRIRIIKRTEGVSTTDLVGRLLLLTRSHHAPSLPAPKRVRDVADDGEAGGAGAAVCLPPPAASPVTVSASYDSCNLSSIGISQFLATTYRLRQFSTGRTPQTHERIVYIDGAFDLLHAGHVHALYAARRLGDFLVVGLHDDGTVNRARGQNHPIMSLHERALCVLSLACVDEVILGAPWRVTQDLLRTMNIATVIGSGDPDVESVDVALPGSAPRGDGTAAEDRYAVARDLGIFTRIEQGHRLRTDDIVQRMIENRVRYEKRNSKREKKELHYMHHEKSYVREL